MAGYVYIMANERNGTLYVGVTNNLVRRVFEHREELSEGFAKRYGTKLLVHYEMFERIDDAIHREKRLKKWPRLWKLRLIEANNPTWRDLYEDIVT